MSSINTTQVTSKNDEALLAFTTLTTKNLLICTKSTSNRHLPHLNDFIRDFYKKSISRQLPCAVKLFTLIYLLRLKEKLPDNARGAYDTPYRLFLAAVLASSKYLSEAGTGLTSITLSYLTNNLYSPKEINQMERSFLGLVRYDLWVSDQDIFSFMDLYGEILDIDITRVNIPEQGTLITPRCLYDNNLLNTANKPTIINTSSTVNNAINITHNSNSTISHPAA